MAISLTVVMFAYNEADNIIPVVDETIAALESELGHGLDDYQLVLVNDGSRDDTSLRIEELVGKYPRITPMDHGTNRGIGAAVKTGFSAARMSHVSILPADGQVTVSEIKKLMPDVLSGADMVVGYYTQRQQVDGGFRMTLSKGLRFGMNVVLGTHRPMDGVYLFRRSLLKEIPLKSETFFVNLELPVRAIRQGFDVRHVPVEVHARRSGSSKVLGMRRIMRVGGEVLKFRGHLIAESLETP